MRYNRIMGTKAWPKLLIDYQNECRKSKPLPTLSDLDTEIEKQKYQVHLQELHLILPAL
jgi:hypothetical protein